MKRKGHNHKESFSILLISNTGQGSKQFHISRGVARLLIFLLILLCAAVGGAGFLAYKMTPGLGEQNNLQAKIDSQQQLIQQLETEKENLSTEKAALEQENEALRQSGAAETADTTSADAEQPADEGEAADADVNIPRRYPSPKTSVVLSSFSEEEPYLAIGLHEEGNIVATGNGTVTSVSSDDTYPVIIEIDHDKGYKTRYMCRQEAEVQASEGAQVEAGDTLFTITVEDAQLDYQILFEEEPIDPLTVIEAKG